MPTPGDTSSALNPVEPVTPIIVMGVCGCGKTTVGRALAAALGRPFLDADDFHPAANREKMRRGVPLTDADRGPWLDALNAELHGRPGVVLACSALRRVYRDRLRAGLERVDFIHLRGDEATLRPRLDRPGHFMPAGLLRSQLDTLEPPTADEALTLDVELPIDQLVAAAVAYVGASRT